MRKYINIVESIDDIIPGELPEYNTITKQLDIMNHNGQAIDYINNPSEDVQLAAVQQNVMAIYYILEKRIKPSIAVQRIAVLQNPLWVLGELIEYNIPISKMIQWTAAKRIKELDLTIGKIGKNILNKLDPDVQEYLRS